MAHFVGEKSSSKLLFISAGDEASKLWLKVFEASEAKDLMRDNGIEPTLVPRVPLTNIPKTDLVPTLGH